MAMTECDLYILTRKDYREVVKQFRSMHARIICTNQQNDVAIAHMVQNYTDSGENDNYNDSSLTSIHNQNLQNETDANTKENLKVIPEGSALSMGLLEAQNRSNTNNSQNLNSDGGNLEVKNTGDGGISFTINSTAGKTLQQKSSMQVCTFLYICMYI